MFRKSTATLSLLLLSVILLPSGKLHAQAGGSLDIVIGPDPTPTGEPHFYGMGGWLELEAGVMMALQVA